MFNKQDVKELLPQNHNMAKTGMAKTGNASKKVFENNFELRQKFSERTKQYNQKRQLEVKPIRDKCEMFLIENKIPNKYCKGRIDIKGKSIHFLSGLKKWLEFEEYLLTFL